MLNIILVNLYHFIADFLCQTRQIANNKSKSVYWLTMHVLTYTTVVTLGWTIFTLDPIVLLQVWLVTFSTHWLTDFITSKGTTYFYLKNNMFGFFGVVGFDQFIHATTLLLTYNYFIHTI